MIPKTVAALDSGTPPDCRLCRRVRLPGRRQMGLRGQARGHLRHHQPAQGTVRAEHHRDDVPLQRQDQEEGLLRLPDEAADHAYPVLDRHAGAGGLQGKRHPEGLEGLLGLLVRQGAGRLPAEDRHAHLRDRPADGRRFQRLVLLVPDLHGRLQRQAGRRQRQAAGRRPEGEGGPGRRAEGLHRHLHARLHAAVVDELEGPGQQRRLPQQDDRSSPTTRRSRSWRNGSTTSTTRR